MSATNDSPYPSIARIVVRPLASPLPLGFFAFGVGTVLLGGVELHWLPPSETKVLATVLLGFDLEHVHSDEVSSAEPRWRSNHRLTYT